MIARNSVSLRFEAVHHSTMMIDPAVDVKLLSVLPTGFLSKLAQENRFNKDHAPPPSDPPAPQPVPIRPLQFGGCGATRPGAVVRRGFRPDARVWPGDGRRVVGLSGGRDHGICRIFFFEAIVAFAAAGRIVDNSAHGKRGRSWRECCSHGCSREQLCEPPQGLPGDAAWDLEADAMSKKQRTVL
jgi:hypothetical protein